MGVLRYVAEMGMLAATSRDVRSRHSRLRVDQQYTAGEDAGRSLQVRVVLH